ncbi:MAG: hypothetical protein K2P58_07535 [Hyphomonadaceae bacterium]|nr:hypothetical protein [Hyphomonadaceae bacterium]
MLVRGAALAALFVLAGCAGMTSAGRNAEPAPPPPAAEQSAPSNETPPAGALPPVAAPNVSVAPAPAPQPPRDPNEVTVPGQVERQVPPPEGDPRSTLERMEDIRAWDQCVTEVQSASEGDPMRPQLDNPEEYCRNALGMSDRLAVPESRRRR